MSGTTVALRLIPLAALVAGCYGEPERLCDRVFISWAFPDHELTAADDVSDEPGLQIDVLLNSELPPGREATLFLVGPDEVEIEHPETVEVAGNGQILFRAVDVPVGSVLFRVRTDDRCRLIETSIRRFVLDELGRPACEISFSPEPTSRVELAPARVYNESSAGAGSAVDVEVEVFTRRPEMSVSLLVTDVDAGATSVDSATVDAAALAAFPISLDEGRHAIRAVCENDFGGVPLSTATFELVVDTTAPNCALIAPSAAVTAGDDIDPGVAGVQIQMVGGTTSTDAIGGAAGFIAGPGGLPDTIDAAPINSAGQASVIATVSTDPADQSYTFIVFDAAGNACGSQATF
jgi:hypothetical protein